MQVVYDPRHVLHDPTTEVQYGVAMGRPAHCGMAAGHRQRRMGAWAIR